MTVFIEGLDELGDIKGTSEFFRFPAKSGRLNVFQTDLVGPGWCRFTVSGRASAVLATATLFEPGRGAIAAVAAHQRESPPRSSQEPAPDGSIRPLHILM